MNSYLKKAGKATTWAAITEVAAKLITPITNMLLARLLTPEAFGVVATITIVISFAEVFTDAGFQKYIIQHPFSTDDELNDNATVAFWTNLLISLIIWGCIIFFRDPIALLVGSPDLGNSIAIACVCIPIMAFSSIQMAMYRRLLDFKTLFFVRMASVLSNLFITVPLAFIIRSYWALIIGTIFQYMANALVLNLRATWHPKFYYKIKILKEMLSFSFWTLLESISIWLTSNGDTFIVGLYLSAYYLGIYKTSIATVNQFTNMIVASTTAVLFSTLSKLIDKPSEYEETFYKFQRLVGILLIPLGVGIFLYSDFVTFILLGNQWTEASAFIGLLGLIAPVSILFGNYFSEVLRSLGRPKLSFLAQTVYLIIMIPTLLMCAMRGYESLYLGRTIIKGAHVVIHLIIVKMVVKLSYKKMIISVLPSIVSTLIMAITASALKMLSSGIAWNFLSVLICISVYFSTLLLGFKSQRDEILSLIQPLTNKFIRHK